MLVWLATAVTDVTVVTVPLEMVTPPDSIATRLRPDVSGMNREDWDARTSIATRIAPRASSTSSLTDTGSGLDSVAMTGRVAMSTEPVTLTVSVELVVTGIVGRL
jgi:hypothetical protein